MTQAAANQQGLFALDSSLHASSMCVLSLQVLKFRSADWPMGSQLAIVTVPTLCPYEPRCTDATNVLDHVEINPAGRLSLVSGVCRQSDLLLLIGVAESAAAHPLQLH